MNCKNSYWIKGAWHSRPCASSTRWIGSYGNLLSSRDHCGETLVLLEAKEQRPVRTGRAGCGDSHFISGTRAGGHQPSSSWQSHSWMAKGGWAVTNINGSCTYAKFSFFGQIFHFLPGSQQPVELVRHTRNLQSAGGTGVLNGTSLGTKLLGGKEPPSRAFLCAPSLPPAHKGRGCALCVGSFPQGNKVKWNAGQKWKHHL